MHHNSIKDLIQNDEEILWQGKPKKSAFIWSKILQLLPIVLIWVLVDGCIIYAFIKTGAVSQVSTFILIIFILFFVLHLTPLWIWIGNIITSTAQYKNTEYVFTTKRIIIRSGVFVDVKSIYYIDVQLVHLNVGLINRILKVSNIHIVSKVERTILFCITDPYRVCNMLQDIVNDLKTDMYYPTVYVQKKTKGIKQNIENRKKSNNKE